MKHAAFLALATLQLVAIALVYVVAMPLLLAARVLIVVCTEATRRPLLAGLVIAYAAVMLWIWTTGSPA